MQDKLFIGGEFVGGVDPAPSRGGCCWVNVDATLPPFYQRDQ